MEHEFLPIGTVIELKNTAVPIMIAGYLSVANSNPDKIWDYSGFLYPLGYVNNDEVISFNHDQIGTVIAYGYKDVEEEEFVEKVKIAKKELSLNSEDTEKSESEV